MGQKSCYFIGVTIRAWTANANPRFYRTFAASASRFRAVIAVVLSISVASHRRPVLLHAIGIVPPPQKGSTTQSPAFVRRLIKQRHQRTCR